MASVQGSKSDSSGRQNFGTLNPVPVLIGEAFGLGSQVTPEGGLAFSQNGTSRNLLANSLFGDLRQPLSTLTQPLNPVTFNSGFAQGLADQATDLFGSTLMPAIEELVGTGFRTSVDPAVELSRVLFEQEFLPSALEQFGSQFGLGGNDSDFQAAVAREASRRAAELGALDIELSESAAGRRAAGIPLAAQINPLSFGDALFGFEQSARQAERLGTPGGQILDLLLTLGDIGTQAGVAGRTDSSSESHGFSIGGS